MAAPELSPVAQSLYDTLGPLAYADADLDYPLARYCIAIAEPFDDVWEWVGVPEQPWENLLDLWETPDDFVDWLGYFKGVEPQTGLDPAAKRARIDEAAGFARGTPASLIAAAKSRLIGSQHVFLEERFGGNAWRLRITVYQSEILDGDVGALTAAILAVKPAGITLDTTTLPGGPNIQPGETWDEVNVATTWDAVSGTITWDTAEGL
jgi:hypothetical protein